MGWPPNSVTGRERTVQHKGENMPSRTQTRKTASKIVVIYWWYKSASDRNEELELSHEKIIQREREGSIRNSNWRNPLSQCISAAFCEHPTWRYIHPLTFVLMLEDSTRGSLRSAWTLSIGKTIWLPQRGFSVDFFSVCTSSLFGNLTILLLLAFSLWDCISSFALLRTQQASQLAAFMGHPSQFLLDILSPWLDAFLCVYVFICLSVCLPIHYLFFFPGLLYTW